MADDDERDNSRDGHRITGWRALGGIIALQSALARYNRRAKQLDPDDPGIVAVSDEAAEVAERAFELAEDGRDDDEAISELVALAKRNRRVLENAERFSRQEARHREDRMFNLAQRLLVAALHERTIEPLGNDEKLLLETIEAFEELSCEEQWAALLARDVQLGELEAHTKSGALRLPPSRNDWAREEVLRQMEREHMLEQTEFGDRLRAVLGPSAGTGDPLLDSRAAYAVALTHLARQLPQNAG